MTTSCGHQNCSDGGRNQPIQFWIDQFERTYNMQHADVMRDIQVTLAQIGIPALRFEGGYLDAQNKPQPCFFLPRFECDLVVSRYSVPYCTACFRLWHKLEPKLANDGGVDVPKFGGIYNKRLAKVIRDIRAALDQAGIDQRKFALVYPLSGTYGNVMPSSLTNCPHVACGAGGRYSFRCTE